ncbi:MAG TPA: right-handed parallel beta-helix repeat-containing protein [Candidatus Angelobacter sp.]|nr:right-handed parallel beta-helix repeat-containing protein [Candidatus Angelobacter sp.]
MLALAAAVGCETQPQTHQPVSRPHKYYVNSETGDDLRSGTSPANAWRTLERVNTQIFRPGDTLLFKAGTRYFGQLKPQGSGTSNAPIVMGKYGRGPLPRIDGQGRVLDTLLLRNVEFWDVSDLDISNLGEQRAPWRTGVRVVTDNFGTMRHIHLQRLFVHDVNGSLSKSNEGCGIYFESRGRRSGSRFDDLLVEDCHVLRTDRNGICQRNGAGIHSLHVVIRGNLLEDIGGDGIKAWGSDAPLIEHNVLRGGRMRCEDYGAGIWPFDCNDALIQFNEVSGMRGTKDGQGFDSDYLCRRSMFQYNYSHDNEGGFMLICSPGNSFNEGTVIRYNISQNDGINSARVFHISGCKNTSIYNNTIYVGAKQDLPLLLFSDWSGGHSDGMKVFNNIFYVDGRVSYEWGPNRNTVFSHNVFYGNHSEIPPDPFATTNRPPLRAPGSGGEGMGSLKGYEPRRAADFPRGEIVPDNGGRDFFRRRVPSDRPPLVGAVSAKE